MSDLLGNQIVGFLMTWLILYIRETDHTILPIVQTKEQIEKTLEEEHLTAFKAVKI